MSRDRLLRYAQQRAYGGESDYRQQDDVNVDTEDTVDPTRDPMALDPENTPGTPDQRQLYPNNLYNSGYERS